MTTQLFRSAWTAVRLAAVAFLFAPALHAQAPIVEEPGYTPTLTFDVVDIRPVPPPDANFKVTVTSPPHSSRFEVSGLPIKSLIQIAYGFDAPVVGLPDWASNTLYSVRARSDEATDARLAKLTDNEVRLEKRYAVRNLLAERLGLKTHTESRNSAVYNLLVGKGGSKMQTTPVPPAAEGAEPPPPAPVNVQTHGSQHGLEFVVTAAPQRATDSILSSMLEAAVIDKTGLTGTYNYTLRFGRPWSVNDPDGYPPLEAAVQEQLGLRLESVHEVVPNLVVDRLTKPTEN